MGVIIDSRLSAPEALAQNPNQPCPIEIVDKLGLMAVSYSGFDRQEHVGQIVLARSLLCEIEEFFREAKRMNFPINKVAPAASPEYCWDDEKLMEANVSSGYNYRLIAGTNQPSKHALGEAFDINPRQNPYIRYENGEEIIRPKDAIWNPESPGTLYAEHPLVKVMENLGWEWGGNWTSESGRIDYQHFEKRSNKA